MTPTRPEIRDWLIHHVVGLADVRPEEIDVGQSVRDYNLDSVVLARLAFDLERWLGVRFSENPLDDDPTIDELSQSLAERVAQ